MNVENFDNLFHEHSGSSQESCSLETVSTYGFEVGTDEKLDDLFAKPDALEDYFVDTDEEDGLFNHGSALCQQPPDIAMHPSSMSLHFDESNTTKLAASQVSKASEYAVANIESIFDQLTAVLHGMSTKMSFRIAIRSSKVAKAVTEDFDSAKASRHRDIVFPGANAHEAWRFTVYLKLLELMHSAILSDTVLSKRDVFYRHPELFVRQSVVDKCVDDIACTFGVSRVDLNITAVAKGLVAGNLNITRGDGSVHSILQETEVLMPNASAVRDIFYPVNTNIVVVEKEATFRSLTTCKAWDAIAPCTIVLTAKGYPDLSTRAFLRRLASARAYHRPRLFFLVDYDPDGLMILLTYAFGSTALAHENAITALPTAQLTFLGLGSKHMLPAISALDAVASPVQTLITEEQLIRLSARDRAKVRRMLLKLPISDSSQLPPFNEGHHLLQNEVFRELQVMLMFNCKAELQILEDGQNRMGDWLQHELRAYSP